MSRKKSKRYQFVRSKPIFVERQVPRQFERAIKIWQGSEQRAFWSNPESSLLWLTGLCYARYNCVVSFMDGLVAAGHDVQIYDYPGDLQVRKHCNHGGVSPVYWLLGYLSGRNEQHAFQRWILQFDMRYRAVVLKTAARHFISYIGSGLESLPQITVPLGLLMSAR